MQSLNIGTYFGIPVKIHWTFGLLIFYVLYVSAKETLSFVDTIFFGLFTMMLFVCVILHEFGHALTARRYGVKTVDIIISPIGGVARLERLPKKPSQELAVAIAGPLVNVAIAAVLLGLGHMIWGLDAMLRQAVDLSNLRNPLVLVLATIGINVVLFLFNLIPAFPMDGGRILRAILTYRFSRATATNIASIIGQFIAVLFIGASIYYGNFQWGLIGIFVLLTARNENKSVQLEEKLGRTTAASLMRSDFTRLFIGDELFIPEKISALTSEKDFLCFDSMGNIAGVLPSQYIAAAKKNSRLSDKVMQHLSDNYDTLAPDASLYTVFNEMNSKGLSLIVIVDGDQIHGVIDRHLLASYVSHK